MPLQEIAPWEEKPEDYDRKKPLPTPLQSETQIASQEFYNWPTWKIKPSTDKWKHLQEEIDPVTGEVKLFGNVVRIGGVGNKEINLTYAVERWKCKYRNFGNTVCTRWSSVLFDQATGKYESSPYCWMHQTELEHKPIKEVTLGDTYTGMLPPDMGKMLKRIIDDPNSGSILDELGLAKTMCAKILKIFSSKPEAFDDPIKGAAIITMTEKIAKIAETHSRIEEKSQQMLNYKQILVLLDAAVHYLAKKFGQNVDQRTVLLQMLPELPWPSGVARVNGAEQFMGKKGQLLLPAAPLETSTVDVDVSWATLYNKKQYRDDLDAPLESHAEIVEGRSNAVLPGVLESNAMRDRFRPALTCGAGGQEDPADSPALPNAGDSEYE